MKSCSKYDVYKGKKKDIPLESHAKCFMRLCVPLILIHYDIAMNIDLTEHILAHI